MKRKPKLLIPKFDSILKHQGCHKAKVSMPNVDVGTFYFNKKNQQMHRMNNYTLLMVALL